MNSIYNCPICETPLHRVDIPDQKLPVVLFCADGLKCEEICRAQNLGKAWVTANEGATGATEKDAYNTLRTAIDKEANK